jgi:23S rRNA pseudouridine2605 synthase
MSYLKKRAESMQYKEKQSSTVSHSSQHKKRPGSSSEATEERLQKIIASTGFCSRRRAEELIQSGEVFVNGKVVTELGFKADPINDFIRVGRSNITKRVKGKTEHLHGVLNKPAGCISTMHDPEGRLTVLKLLTKKFRTAGLKPVGRLDTNTEGILLFTNDGELLHRLTHPSFGIRRRYLVRARGKIEYYKFDELVKNGANIDGAPIKNIDVKEIRHTEGSTWFEIEVGEGKNREIKKIVEALGSEVSRLKRIAYGPIESGIPPKGKFRELKESEVKELYSMCKLHPDK